MACLCRVRFVPQEGGRHVALPVALVEGLGRSAATGITDQNVSRVHVKVELTFLPDVLPWEGVYVRCVGTRPCGVETSDGKWQQLAPGKQTLLCVGRRIALLCCCTRPGKCSNAHTCTLVRGEWGCAMDLSCAVQRMVGRGDTWTAAKRRKLQEAFQARVVGDTLAEGLARDALPITTKQCNK